MTVVPYKERSESKKQQVATMFDNISKKYDFLNHLLSLGIDISWRRKAIKKLQKLKPSKILDIATGTGDFALEALKLKPEKIIGVDISDGMLTVGREKMVRKKVSHIIDLQSGDSENLQFPDNFFDAVIVSFGVRNFENLEKGLSEMHRVIRPGGMAVILEFSKPEKFPIRQIYNFYFKVILPKIGRLFSGDTSAYTYLPESVQEFPYGKKFVEILGKVGFKYNQCYPQTLGISSIYTGEK
ncbi:MAG TPA: bifunctional demethylmenaquinone methyltransferase/2-methoxy-6-polyprenyl-1,4-benzoquinol methylase UbiE [Cyclobacteriaceae bacterium]|jgi:demethylmenaquinone methyltransferase/2-methoxy-6-polyprenyl-1,4-benzoquinol methylase